MGHKKGKQAGQFNSKRANSLYRYTINREYAAEADEFRNPARTSFRADDLNNLGRWHRDGTGVGGRDKWATLFSSKSPTSSVSHVSNNSSSNNNNNNINSATVGRSMTHLRFLLEERRLEDRIDDRQLRLRLQNQRMKKVHRQEGGNCCAKNILNEERHQPGWLLTHDKIHDNNSKVPSLQKLAAQSLGAFLPIYVAACGHEYVGNALQSVSSDGLCEISISLANSLRTEATITDGVLKSLVYSGVASKLVLRGMESPFDDEYDRNDEDDVYLLSDEGLLSICPRIYPFNNDDENDDSSCDNWETVAHGIVTVGCYHLTRLELIDIPLNVSRSATSSGGISIDALRSVLKSCPGITHLGLSGCFSNWHQNTFLIEQAEDVNMLICGSLPPITTVLNFMQQQLTSGRSDQISIPQYFDHFRCRDGDIVSGLDDLLPDLKVLDLSHCSWLTPDALKLFLLKCKQRANVAKSTTTIQHVNILGCESIVTASFLQWLEEWKKFGLLDGIEVSRQRQNRGS